MIERSGVSRITDTAENAARFVAGAPDSLWDTKHPGRFERVGRRPSGDATMAA